MSKKFGSKIFLLHYSTDTTSQCMVNSKGEEAWVEPFGTGIKYLV
jgi:hypothetical protein